MRRFTLILPVLLVCQLPAVAQIHFSLGAVGGVRLSRNAYAAYHDESRRYTVGPAVEASFGEHLAAEVDALYSRLGYSYTYSVSLGSSETIPLSYVIAHRGRAHSAEIPVMGKYYFGARNSATRLFVATGYSFQHSWSTATTSVLQGPPLISVMSASLGNGPTQVGAAFGAGLTRKTGPVTLQPAFRYTRWGASTGANQMVILLGIWF